MWKRPIFGFSEEPFNLLKDFAHKSSDVFWGALINKILIFRNYLKICMTISNNFIKRLNFQYRTRTDLFESIIPIIGKRVHN